LQLYLDLSLGICVYVARHVQLQFETAGIILQFETAGIICLHEHYRRNEIGLIVKLRHQFIHLFDNISEGDIKGFVFQHNSEVYKFISAAVDLFD